MKVAFIIPSLANKGPNLVVKNLVSGLVSKNIHCVVYYFDDICEIAMDAPTQKLSFTQSIVFNEFDVVHSHGIRPDAYVFWHKPQNCSAHCISTLHSFLKIDLSYQYNAFVAFFAVKMWRFFLKRHDTIAVLSNTAKQYYRKWFPRKSIKVAYNAREIDLSNSETLAYENEIVQFKNQYSIIGVNALLTKIKGINLLIETLPLLPNYALVIVGDGKERAHLERLALQKNVKNRCLFTGYQKNAFRYLKFYDIFAMSSYSEGFPLSLLEAAQYKKNTICSDIDIFRELFSEEEVSFFELDNPKSLVNAILLASQSPKGQHFYEFCLKKYSLDVFTSSYLQIYNQNKFHS